MSLLALIAALSLEQFYPYAGRARFSAWLKIYLRFFQRHFNAGEHHHGKVAWLLAVLPVLALAWLAHWLLGGLHPVLGWMLDITVLYLCMGFQRYSTYYLAIYRALREARLDEAERVLAEWRGVNRNSANAEQIARLSIEQAVLVAQHRVFGVIVWFVLFATVGGAGAAGALLYRLALYLRDGWHDGQETDPFGDFSQQACAILTWLPTRMSAISYAIVGNFEDTLYCWRSQAQLWPAADEGVVLASAAGSLGIRLGMDITGEGKTHHRPELGLGEDADPEAMQSVTGLVWRALVVWLIVILLLSLANLLA